MLARSVVLEPGPAVTDMPLTVRHGSSSLHLTLEVQSVFLLPNRACLPGVQSTGRQLHHGETNVGVAGADQWQVGERV